MTKAQKVAIVGVEPVLKQKLRIYNRIGSEEIDAALSGLRSRVLSEFIGASGPKFRGGSEVKEFERRWSIAFDVKHAISFNSWIWGLLVAVGAIDIEPSDEGIATPWTMAATATSILYWNGIAVFADIWANTMRIDPASVESCIIDRNVEILSVDIVGRSADMVALRNLADRYGLKLISDSAQAPGSRFGIQRIGTLADTGGFSLNYHQRICTGEGGIAVTNDDHLAEWQDFAQNLTDELSEGPGIALANMPDGDMHCYYAHPIAVDPEYIGVSNDFRFSRKFGGMH